MGDHADQQGPRRRQHDEQEAVPAEQAAVAGGAEAVVPGQLDQREEQVRTHARRTSDRDRHDDQEVLVLEAHRGQQFAQTDTQALSPESEATSCLSHVWLSLLRIRER